jgi:hypothetical protein
MANRLLRAVDFTFEPDVVTVYAQLNFSAGGAVTYTPLNSKGICAVTPNSISITGTTTSSSPTVTSVSSFVGIYNGMTVTGTNIPANTTISSMNAAGGTITLSQNATGANTGLTISGGQYLIQFGQQAGVRLDTYNKLLYVDSVWDESTNQGSLNTSAVGPGNPVVFVVGNNIAKRTIPPVGNSANTDATITLQFGSGAGSSFVAANPTSGEVLRLAIDFCRSGAI